MKRQGIIIIRKLTLAIALLSAAQALARPSQFCTGDRVISDTGVLGTVVAIFPNGDVSVHFDYRQGAMEQTPKMLARTHGCTRDHYCVKARVVSGTGVWGTIGGIFSDGEVAVHYDYHPGYMKQSTSILAMTDSCSWGCFHRAGYAERLGQADENGLQTGITASKSKGLLESIEPVSDEGDSGEPASTNAQIGI